MPDNPDDADPERPATLPRARAVIARQAAELAELRARLAASRSSEEFQVALTVAAATGTLAAPANDSRLLEMIVRTAAQAINAEAGSLFLLDAQRHALVFEVSSGQHAPQNAHFTVPLGQGIAGLVALSGQPMIVADAQSDPRHAAAIAQQQGYLPRSILCVPLVYADEVIGVLELLDKAGVPTFSAADMALLSLFANLAAVAIEQTRTAHSLIALIGDALAVFAGVPADQLARLRELAGEVVTHMETGAATYTRALELARLAQQVAATGEHEAALCASVLRDFAAYARGKPTPGAEPGGLW